MRYDLNPAPASRAAPALVVPSLARPPKLIALSMATIPGGQALASHRVLFVSPVISTGRSSYHPLTPIRTSIASCLHGREVIVAHDSATGVRRCESEGAQSKDRDIKKEVEHEMHS